MTSSSLVPVVHRGWINGKGHPQGGNGAQAVRTRKNQANKGREKVSKHSAPVCRSGGQGGDIAKLYVNLDHPNVETSYTVITSTILIHY